MNKTVKKKSAKAIIKGNQTLGNVVAKKENILQIEPTPVIEKPIISIPEIEESSNNLIRKIHHFFISNINYLKPMTIHIIAIYNMINSNSEEEEERKVIGLMQEVINHYKDIEPIEYEGKTAYHVIKLSPQKLNSNPFIR